MITITSIVTTGRQGSSLTIHGTGFGASQEQTSLLFYPVLGFVVSVTPTAWADTGITCNVPIEATLGATAFIALQEVSAVGVRSPTTFPVLAAVQTPWTTFPSESMVSVPYGTEPVVTLPS